MMIQTTINGIKIACISAAVSDDWTSIAEVASSSTDRGGGW